MIKNIIFDISNVILNFNVSEVLTSFTKVKENQKFILDNIINSPEWLGNSLIDTGFIKREDAIEIVKDRTNHVKDKLISNFWNTYNDFAFIDNRVIDLIKQLKNNNYRVYLLSNTNPYTHDFVSKSGVFELVDGYVLSYIEHQIKPYQGIYKTLINRYNLTAEECLFIDDKYENVKTANELGIKGENVQPDDYESIIKLLEKYDIKRS
ncbi:MAG: HAD family phosphatase [Clostridia bacterium]|nr:HAD family phosphatase [Clostridia bacterium]